ncbi:unnamed protein product [Chrysoparadoxa australica]
MDLVRGLVRSEFPEPSCNDFTTCRTCAVRLTCGWCEEPGVPAVCYELAEGKATCTPGFLQYYAASNTCIPGDPSHTAGMPLLDVLVAMFISMLMCASMVAAKNVYAKCRQSIQLRSQSSPSLPSYRHGFGCLSTRAKGAARTADDECSICLARYKVGQKVRLLPACKHTFHARCIDRWLAGSHSNCPLCKGDAFRATNERAGIGRLRIWLAERREARAVNHQGAVEIGRWTRLKLWLAERREAREARLAARSEEADRSERWEKAERGAPARVPAGGEGEDSEIGPGEEGPNPPRLRGLWTWLWLGSRRTAAKLGGLPSADRQGEDGEEVKGAS